MSTNNNAKTGNGRVPVIGPGVVYSSPVPLDASAWRGGIVAGANGRIFVSDGSRWRDIPFADEARTLTEAPALVTVGAGGDFPSLNAAFAFLAQFSPPRANFTLPARTELRMLAGFVPADPLFVSGFDFGWVEMTAVDSVTLVPLAACGDPANPVTPNTAFFMIFGGPAPSFSSVVFRLDYTWTSGTTIDGVTYVGASFNGPARLFRSGFQNFSDNVRASGGSTVDIIWSTANIDARRYGLEVLPNGAASVRGATIRGGTQSVRVRNGGVFSVREVGGDVSAGGITISDLRRTAGSDSSADVFVLDGGVAQLKSGTLGGANVPFNVPTSAGIVYKDGTPPQEWPGIIAPQSYTVATVPSAAAYPSRLIHVSNGDTGAPCLAVSNGTNWLRIPLGAAVST